MRKRIWLLAICVLLGTQLGLPLSVSAAANERAFFELALNDEEENVVKVSVKGGNLDDVYAFELNLNFDSDRLRYKSSNIALKGFTIDPLIEGNRLRLVHTQTGSGAGEKGEKELATITFERIREGEALVSFLDVRLVDSELRRIDFTPETKLTIPADIGTMGLSDIAGHWAEAAIREGVELGFVTGYPDGSFKPDKQVTRAEFAAMTVRALQLPDATSQLEYSDSSSIPAWARPYIGAATEAKLMGGYEDLSFRANRNITRTELAAIVSRALGLELDEGAQPGFADAEQIPAWALQSVAAVEQAGIMQGRGGNRFVPSANATRAEAVTIIGTIVNEQRK